MNKVIYKGTQYNSGDIIENGVVINDGAAVVEGTDTTTTVVREGGERYYYGEQGQRFVWQKHIVLMPNNFEEDDYVTPQSIPNNSSSISNLLYHPIKDDEIDFKTVKITTVGNFTKEDPATQSSFITTIDSNSSLYNLIRPSDLYNYTRLYYNGNLKQLTYDGNNNQNKLNVFISHADNNYYVCQLKYGETYILDGPSYRIPKNSTTFGIFLMAKQWSSSGIIIRLGFAAFDDTQTEEINGEQRSKLLALFPLSPTPLISSTSGFVSSEYYPWSDTNEYDYASSITAKYSYITKDEYDELTTNG